MTGKPFQVLYCHCAFARVVPVEVRNAVLERLAESSIEFEAVPDLCEMSARKDPRLAELSSAGTLRVAACFPRAVHGLFEAAGAKLAPSVQILNMRTETADAVAGQLLAESSG